LDSLLSQTYPGITVCIRDDGSSDPTKAVINAYKGKFPDKVNLLEDELGNVGIYRSFRMLVEKCDADYYLFCDQDDIWDEDKVAILLRELNALENKYSANLPCLICSDYRTINEDAELIVPSSFKEYGLKNRELVTGLFQGLLPGCAMIFNKPARDLFLKFDGLGLHDKQLLILSFIFGQIGLCYAPTMSYRMHSRNAVGLRRNVSKIILLKDLIKFIFDSKEYRRILLREYFEMHVQLSRQICVGLLHEKELFSATEIDEMKCFRRKRWFLNHFKPFARMRLQQPVHMCNFEGLIQLILF
jgi:glycosyltransferase involved in cell wall biosynthesis